MYVRKVFRKHSAVNRYLKEECYLREVTQQVTFFVVTALVTSLTVVREKDFN